MSFEDEYRKGKIEVWFLVGTSRQGGEEYGNRARFDVEPTPADIAFIATQLSRSLRAYEIEHDLPRGHDSFELIKDWIDPPEDEE